MQRIKSGQLPGTSLTFNWSLYMYVSDTRSPPPEADAYQSLREKSQNFRNELQLGVRRAVPRRLRQQSGARDASERQCRWPARRVQSPTMLVAIRSRVECVPHERLGHTARVFDRKRAGHEVDPLAGGTEPQRQRVARGAARADWQKWTNQLRAEWLASAHRQVLLHVYGAVPCGERPAHCAPPPHPRARKVLLVLSDVLQRHARRDVLPVSGPVGARASTARWPAGGTRAHSVRVSR